MARTDQPINSSYDAAKRFSGKVLSSKYQYFNPLINDIRPEVGTEIPAVTRASAATVVDYAGRMHFVPSGEIRFRGARRVYNLLADSESFVTGWTPGASVVVATPADAASRETVGIRRTAKSVTRSSGSATCLLTPSASYRPGPYVFSVGLQADTAMDVLLRMEISSGAVLVSEKLCTIGPVMKRFAISGTIASTANHRLIIDTAVASPVTFYVNSAMRTFGDEVHEYVARGVAGAAAPFDGAGIDGAKYYPYMSGMSINSSTGEVVDTGPGSPILDSVLQGVLVEPKQSVQRFYSSGDVGDTTYWTHTNVTLGSLASCKLLGPVGMRGMSDGTASGQHRMTQAWKLTTTDAQIKSVSFYVYQAGAPDWVYCGFLAKDGTTEYKVWFDVKNLKIGTKSGGADLTYIVPDIYKEGDMVRIGFSAPGLTAGSNEVGFFGFANADGVDTYTGTNQTAYIGASQFELSDMPSSYVGDTAGAILTRVDELFTFTRANVLPASGWGLSCELSCAGDTNAPNRSTWWYMIYWYLSSTNRGGLTMRRGGFAGGTPGEELTWPYDYYYNSASTEITTIQNTQKKPWQRFKMAARLSKTPGSDSNMVKFACDGALSASSGGTPSGGIAIADTVILLYFGQPGPVSGNNSCFKGTYRNFGILNYTPTDNDLKALSM